MVGANSGRLRKLWLDIHLWLGVGLMIALVPIAVSGALLVWHEPLEHMIERDRYTVSDAKPTLAPSIYLAAAEKAFAGRATPSSLRLPDQPGVPVTVVGRLEGPPAANGRPRQLTAWLDPATARVTDTAEISQSMFSIMHRLHGTLLIPQVGRKFVGWMGWAMTVSAITGLILWWPRNGAFLKGLRWRRTPMTMDNLHHVTGFWVCVPLLVLSLTGVYISFPQTSRAVFGVDQAQQSPPRPRNSPAPLPQPSLFIDQAAAAAVALAPGAAPAVINLPTAGEKPNWRIELRKPGAERVTIVQVSDSNGQAKLDPRGGGGRGGPDKLSRLMRQIHDGADTGPIWQTIIFLGGMAPLLLGVTGVVMWLRKQSRKVAMSRRLAAAE